MKITRRFSVPGSQYDYIVLEDEGEPVDVVTRIWQAFYIELAMLAKLNGHDFDLEKIYNSVTEASNSIKDSLPTVTLPVATRVGFTHES